MVVIAALILVQLLGGLVFRAPARLPAGPALLAPVYLAEATRPVTALRGVGPVLAGHLARLGIRTLADLLRYAPRDYQDRRRRDHLAEAAGLRTGQRPGAGRLRALVRPSRPPRVFKAEVEDESGRAALLCFGRPFLSRQLLPGRRFWVSGRFQPQRGELACGASSWSPTTREEESRIVGRILPVYPLTEGVSQRALRLLVAQALEAGRGSRTEAEELPEGLRARHGLPGIREALRGLHFPQSEERAGPRAPRPWPTPSCSTTSCAWSARGGRGRPSSAGASGGTRACRRGCWPACPSG